jgi:ubiquinone/menaquinone biosynthesis C-methylase UbiE
MDLVVADPAELRRALRDLAWINRHLGGRRLIRNEIPPLLRGLPAPVRVLDVGTGYADIPRAIVRWARRRGLAMEMECLDHNRQVLELAIQASSTYPEIRFQEGEAGSLPFEDGSFDVVLSSLTLHHLEGDEPVEALREMYRVARRAVLVNDLRRGLWPYLVTRACLLAVSRNRLIRYDGPLSVRRSFLAGELERMAGLAGWKRIRISRHPFFRLALVGEKD